MDPTSKDVARFAPARRRVRGRRVAGGAVCAVTVCSLAVAAGLWVGGGSGPAAVPATAAPSARPATTAPALPAPEAPATAAPAVLAPPEPILQDGRHPVFLTGLDVTGSTVEFDLVQYLTGDALRDYEAEQREYDPDFETYDNVVINDNPRLRTLPVTPGAAVTVLRTPDSSVDPHPIGFADLPAYVDEFPYPGELGGSVFWLTVRDDTVVAVEEQFSA